MSNSENILVIGGSGDIGSVIANFFIGDNVTSTDSKKLNLLDKKSIESFFREKENEGVFFDVLVFCPGINKPETLDKLNASNFNDTLQVNCLSLVSILSQNFMALKKLRSMAIVGSLYSFYSRKGRLSYATSKHALEGVVKTFAIELADKGINVNIVSPGFIDTKMTRKNNSAKQLDRFRSAIPLQHLGKPIDIANAVYFLTRKESFYITGVNLVVDGGFSTGGFQNLIDE
jgi:NAD(P)-dependent dehydrogenase (short-subunit alcohol dehydrogenase family)